MREAVIVATTRTPLTKAHRLGRGGVGMHHALLTRQQGAVRILVNNNPDVRNAITQGLYNGCHAP